MKKKSEAKKQGVEAIHFPKKCECMPQKTIEELQEVLKRQGIDGKLRLCKEVCVKVGTLTNTLAFGHCKVPVESESPQPRSELLAWINNNYNGDPGTRDFGEERLDQFWAHSLTDLAVPGYLCEIQGAVLEVMVQNKHDNDTLNVGCINSPNDSWEVSKRLTDFGVQVGQTKKITVDLRNVNGMNLLGVIMSNGFLDVAVQDDSTVYCVKLSLRCRCIPIDFASHAPGNKGGFAVGGFNAA